MPPPPVCTLTRTWPAIGPKGCRVQGHGGDVRHHHETREEKRERHKRTSSKHGMDHQKIEIKDASKNMVRTGFSLIKTLDDIDNVDVLVRREKTTLLNTMSKIKEKMESSSI